MPGFGEGTRTTPGERERRVLPLFLLYHHTTLSPYHVAPPIPTPTSLCKYVEA